MSLTEQGGVVVDREEIVEFQPGAVKTNNQRLDDHVLCSTNTMERDNQRSVKARENSQDG